MSCSCFRRTASPTTRDYAPRLFEGDRLLFELRANPTVRHGHDGKSSRHDVVMEAKKKLMAEHHVSRWVDWHDVEKPSLIEVAQVACTNWLQCKAGRLGFVLDLGTLVVASYEQHKEKPDQMLRFSTVDLSGQLTVTDPEAFSLGLLNGVGSAKAFGCGLLLIRRLE